LAEVCHEEVLTDWAGKTVHVILRASVPTPLQGELLEFDESGIVLLMPKGHTFIPMTSILHVSLLDES
jgi:hypothetical protein